jgi:hypothetical protein
MDTNSYAFIRGYLANRRFIRKIIKRSAKESMQWKKYYSDPAKVQEARYLRKEIVRLQKQLERDCQRFRDTGIFFWEIES